MKSKQNKMENRIMKNECYEVTSCRSKDLLFKKLIQHSRKLRKDVKILICFQNTKIFLNVSQNPLSDIIELCESNSSNFGLHDNFVIQYGKVMTVSKDDGDEFKIICQDGKRKIIDFESFLGGLEYFTSDLTRDEGVEVDTLSSKKTEGKHRSVDTKNESLEKTVSVRTGKNVPESLLAENITPKLSKSIMPSSRKPVKKDTSMMKKSSEKVCHMFHNDKVDGAAFDVHTQTLVKNSEKASLSKVVIEEVIIEESVETKSDINQADVIFNVETQTLVKESDVDPDSEKREQAKGSCASSELDSVSADGNTDASEGVSEGAHQIDLYSQNISTSTQSEESTNETSETKSYSYKQKINRQQDKASKKYLKKRKAEKCGKKKWRIRKIKKSSFLKQWKKRKKHLRLKRKLKYESPAQKNNYKKGYFGKKLSKARGWSWNSEESLKEKYLSDDVNAFLEKSYEESKKVTMLLRNLTDLLHYERSWNISGYVYPTRRGKHNKGNRRNQQGRTHSSQAVEGVEDLGPTQVSDAANESLDLPPAELVITSSSSTFRSFSNNVPSPTPSSMVSIDSERSLRTRLRGELPDNRFSRAQARPKHPEYSDQPSRQRSFRNWPATTGQDPARMAVYGFFYTGRVDLIRCYTCGIGLKDWAGADEPLFEHIKHSPDCVFLKDLLGEELLSAYKDNLRANQMQQARNRAAGNEGAEQVRNPQYSDAEARLRTFDKWPSSGKQRPQTLVDAGLFYTGTNDLCRCFSCDGGLQRWDSEDDPWIEHARWFPKCHFVKRVKGQDYINMVQEAAAQARAEEEGQAVASPASGQGAARTGPVQQGIAEISLEDNSSLNSSAARAVIGMGYSRRAVQLAIQEFNRQAPVGGQNDFSSADLTRILRDMERRGEDLPPDSPTESNMGATAAIASPENMDPAEENRRLREILRCMQCQENETNILFLPCTHHRMCEDCAQKVIICPVCGVKITEKIKTYLS